MRCCVADCTLCLCDGRKVEAWATGVGGEVAKCASALAAAVRCAHAQAWCDDGQGVNGAALLAVGKDRLKQLGLKSAQAAALLAATAELQKQTPL